MKCQICGWANYYIGIDLSQKIDLSSVAGVLRDGTMDEPI